MDDKKPFLDLEAQYNLMTIIIKGLKKHQKDWITN